GHDLVELCGGLLDKRVDQLVLAAEVPVDTGDSDTEMASELGHAQLIDTLRLDEFEGLRDDLLTAQRPPWPTGRPSRLCPRLPCSRRHADLSQQCALQLTLPKPVYGGLPLRIPESATLMPSSPPGHGRPRAGPPHLFDETPFRALTSTQTGGIYALLILSYITVYLTVSMFATAFKLPVSAGWGADTRRGPAWRDDLHQD